MAGLPPAAVALNDIVEGTMAKFGVVMTKVVLDIELVVKPAEDALTVNVALDVKLNGTEYSGDPGTGTDPSMVK